MKRIFGLVVAASLATGCAPYGRAGYAHYGHPRGAAAILDVFVAGAVLAAEASRAADASDAEASEPPSPTIIVVQAGPPPPPAQMLPPAAPEPPHVSFDAGAALDALRAIDLTACVDRGAPSRTYGHARVTFAPTGQATAVVIDRPTALPPDAVTCLGDRLGRASAPAFDGSPATIGTGFVVK
jgi:hypothetical protein